MKYVYGSRNHLQHSKLKVFAQIFTVVLFVAVLSILPSTIVLSQNSHKNIQHLKIGASLRKYKQPPKSHCDIKVPTQYQTIQQGIDAASSGNTVCVFKGTYGENISINKSLRLVGMGAAKTSIIGQTADSTLYVAGDGNANNVIVEGFLIRGTDGTGLNDPSAVNVGPFASDVILRHNIIEAGNAQLAIRFDSGQSNDLVYNNVLEGNNSPVLVKVSGVQGPSYKVSFLNNTFQGSVNLTNPDNGRVIETWATDSDIQSNIFNTSGDTISVIDSVPSSNVVAQNNFNSAVLVKVRVYSGGPMNAENNWWGDLDPSDNIQGDIDFAPFATQPFAEY